MFVLDDDYHGHHRSYRTCDDVLQILCGVNSTLESWKSSYYLTVSLLKKEQNKYQFFRQLSILVGESAVSNTVSTLYFTKRKKSLLLTDTKQDYHINELTS